MLFKQNGERHDKKLFENPTAEYRGAPFWAWNCKLNKELLERQIDCLKQMGLGGFHMHSRTGMATKYLSDEFMELVKACVDKAEKENMLAWLYDEDRWASGAAGGIVTADPKYRVRKLLFTHNERTDCVPFNEAVTTGKPYFAACYDITLNAEGELERYKKAQPHEKAEGERWYAYVMTNDPSPWFNNQTYVDTLSGEAIDKFIEVTYEGYKRAIGDRFGKSVPAMFTDEPQFERKTTLDFANDKKGVTLPWSNDVPQTYMNEYGCDIFDTLPELVWELPGGAVSKTRYRYHDHIAERFASAFADSCGGWCDNNNIMLTGHMMAEETLASQTSCLGDAMRSYRSFQLPGIDMLCDKTEYATAKQAQSASHQYGREGVLSELYGVTNWNFDFRGHKFQGDWQAALGVTVRVHHLSWVSMAGEAKRDYPASISYQSPWYKEYSYVEDHFARLNTVLTRGKPMVRVGVIHPVESYWLHWGPKENTAAVREQLDSNFENITKWLLFGQIDFDFICESLLPDLCGKGGNPLKVGEMEYDTVIVPGCETLRGTTLERLTAFKEQGGNVIFLGECPKYIDAEPSAEPQRLYDISEKVPFSRVGVLEALKKDRLVEIRNSNGMLASNLLYNMRQDSDCTWLFIARGVKTVHTDVPTAQKITIKIRGRFFPKVYDTISGSASAIGCTHENGMTIINTQLHFHDSLLLRLDEKAAADIISIAPEKQPTAVIDFKKLVPYKRDEPNVLLLDMAQYAFDGGEYFDTEDLLKADNTFRKKLGFPPREDHVAQPWTYEDETPKHFITLKFGINSEIDVEKPVLAIEDAQSLDICLNGKRVECAVTGFYIDEAIKTIALPPLAKGENELVVKIPFGKTTNVEYCYLLGEFNVRVEGVVKTITAPTDKIGFSSITSQGLPFYGGNIKYTVEVKTQACSLAVKAANYRGALVSVDIDGKRAGVICYSPYKLMIDGVKAGKHVIELTLFGNRYNTLAALHNTDSTDKWFGPNIWRKSGDAWCYEYRLKDTGILASPVIEIYDTI